jgi:hypothetical protein
MGVQFAVQSLNGPSRAEPLSILYRLIWYFLNLEGQVPVYIYPPGTGLKNLHDLSPQANYTDRATAACQRSQCQLFPDRWCHVVSVTNSCGCILDFLDRSRYYCFQVAPQLHSRGWVDPVADPLLFFCSADNRTRDLRIFSQELWPLDHRGGPRNRVAQLYLRALGSLYVASYDSSGRTECAIPATDIIFLTLLLAIRITQVL